MSIKRISISFALSVILALWIPLKCMATVSDAVNYSSDFFNSDYGRALVIQNALNNMGRSVSISSRPTVAYGVSYQLSICPSYYISSHGHSNGSQVTLVSGTTYYTPANVPSSVTAEFVYYSACYSSKTNTVSNQNLCTTTVSNGATCVVGYSGEVHYYASDCLERSFYGYCVSPSPSVYIPVSWAMAQAKTYTNSVCGATNTATTYVQMYGNGGYHF